MTDNQPQRKDTWTAAGSYWSTTSVPRLYLEDIENIFDVMQIYAPNSPSAVSERASRQWIESRYQLTMEEYKQAEPKPPKPPELPPPLDPPVIMETEDYIAHTKEQLRNIQPKSASRFEMRVGVFDLTVSCFNWMISVATISDDPNSVRAFNEIKRVIQKRESRSWLPPFTRRLRTAVLSLLLVVTSVNLFVASTLLSTANLALAAVAWWIVILRGWLWTRSKGDKPIVVLRNKDEAPTFWEEHRRGIMAAVISGAIVTMFVTVLALIAQR
ncbi:MAG: hypothetical protein M3354_09110 [Chloroflexota bacterium]|nr:hypothetical protein [Chloroflexota bacterium]